MKINKQSLRQIIKEELQNVLEQDELDGDTLAGKTMAVDEPPRDELDGDTLAGKTMAVDDPQQDVQQMATKYAKVKQILAKLVSEL
jgi:hypothetical protein